MQPLTIRNPNAAQPPTLARPIADDVAVINTIISRWPATENVIPVQRLADLFAASLDAATVRSIQTAYPAGIGAYVLAMLQQMGLLQQ